MTATLRQAAWVARWSFHPQRHRPPRRWQGWRQAVGDGRPAVREAEASCGPPEVCLTGRTAVADCLGNPALLVCAPAKPGRLQRKRDVHHCGKPSVLRRPGRSKAAQPTLHHLLGCCARCRGGDAVSRPSHASRSHTTAMRRCTRHWLSQGAICRQPGPIRQRTWMSPLQPIQTSPPAPTLAGWSACFATPARLRRPHY